MATAPDRFLVLVYRMPAKPTAGRVAVWRQLKKIGAIYLQQSACVFPDNPRVRKDLAPILARVTEESGEYHLLPLRKLDGETRLLTDDEHAYAQELALSRIEQHAS